MIGAADPAQEQALDVPVHVSTESGRIQVLPGGVANPDDLKAFCEAFLTEFAKPAA